MKLENLLTVQEAAELTGVSKVTIYDWMKSGELGYIQKGSCRLINKGIVLHISEMKAQRWPGGTPRRGKKNSS